MLFDNWHCWRSTHTPAHLHETINLLTHIWHTSFHLLFIDFTDKLSLFSLRLTTVQGVALKEATDIVCHSSIVVVINITWLVFYVSPVPTHTFVLLMFTYSIWKEDKITVLLMCLCERRLFISKFIQTESDAHFGLLFALTDSKLEPGKNKYAPVKGKRQSPWRCIHMQTPEYRNRNFFITFFIW